MTIQSAIRTDNLTTRHAGFARVFQPGRLTFGFIAPLEGYPDRPAPTMRDHLAMARKADDAGFAAVWLRDVPFFDRPLAMSARCSIRWSMLASLPV